uniref:Protein YIF1 n=1 Tax=Trieres chinensis TaxID=1514140 RepID=A0A7S1Z347_TRICV|eukprot:CAMPEP_0183309058 /NCGR_PEP_ID=MMETSP0160_2-20130417/23741_1 /TAXON_ID=2839 ORGANISM="Odontella Sinensis, Strain Grunow 1884" /NCGR_SAMPLE_ID=MMETSP0160_2 /ASSEMBLY_ACC=CAM_ASM_000250 /LENGTH=357 /DNA_ID=CAMNT_0025473007 /DNA_START=56 /DNA_END=1129 /DNA_ORIENTATION=-
MSDFYSAYPSQPEQRHGASSSGAGGNSTGGAPFYGQGGFGQQQQGNGSASASSSSYGAYGGAQQSWQQQPLAPEKPSNNGTMEGSYSNQPAQQPLFDPSMAAAAMTSVAAQGFTPDAMFGQGQKLVEGFLDKSTARFIPGLDLFMRTLRVYFAVDNRFVKGKAQRVLFPFVYKDWARLEDQATTPSDNNIAYCPPVQDINAFDLYIPLMTLITYVLLCALCYGTAGEFNPEVLPDVTTKCFLTQILEVLAIRGGFFAMHAPVKLLDLFSVTGYKYLGLSINMLVGLLFSHLGWGYRGYYGTFLWTASAVSYFMLKTMANNIPRVVAATGPKREFMVLGFAASQFVTMWFVSQTKFLD